MDSALLKTACHDWHVAHGGRMVDFAGWSMPVQYSTIIAEHHAVRRAAGLFDIAHMGRLYFYGDDAGAFVDHLVTIDATSLPVGRVRYALMTNEQGGILDDVLVYRFDEYYMLVVNASNRLKILAWIEEQRAGYDVQLSDRTFELFMLAIQGPKSVEILHPFVDNDVAAMNYYWGIETDVLNVPALVSRTGYTGEDGFEVILPAEHGSRLWEAIIDRGRDFGLLPTGLGCRDTLRLEAAMPLYGHELDESIDPFTAGIGSSVNLTAGDFVGKESLTAAKGKPDRPRRVGLDLHPERRIARQGAAIFVGDRQVGQVTSGTFSPTLERSIAMGYIDPQFAAVGTDLQIDIRGSRLNARVVKLPFYKRK